MLLSVQTNIEPWVDLLQRHDAGEMQRVTCSDVPLLAALTSFLSECFYFQKLPDRNVNLTIAINRRILSKCTQRTLKHY